MAAKKSSSWSPCKKAIAGWPRPGLVALLKELHDLSDANRRFLEARLIVQDEEAAVHAAAKEISGLLNVRNPMRFELDPRAVYRIVDQFRKATNSSVGQARLLITAIESGFLAFAALGDDEATVNMLFVLCDRLNKVLESLQQVDLSQLLERLQAVADRFSGEFGYGISDEFDAVVAIWCEKSGVAWKPKWMRKKDTP